MYFYEIVLVSKHFIFSIKYYKINIHFLKINYFDQEKRVKYQMKISQRTCVRFDFDPISLNNRCHDVVYTMI